MLSPTKIIDSLLDGNNNSSNISVLTWGVAALVALSLVTSSWNALAMSKEERQTRKKLPRAQGYLPVFQDNLVTAKHIDNHTLLDYLDKICQTFKNQPWLFEIYGRPSTVVLSTPEHFEDVEKTHFQAFDKGEWFNDNLHDLLGEGIFAVDGAKWLHQRKTAVNLFTLNALRDKMARVVRFHAATAQKILLRAAENKTPIDLFRLMNRFTMEAFSEIGFGVRLECLDVQEDHPFQTAFDSAQHTIFLRFMRPNWFWKIQRLLGVGVEAQLLKDIKVIDDTVYDIISKSLAARAERAAAAAQAKIQKDEVEDDEEAEEERIRNGDIVSLFLDDSTNLDSGKSGAEFDPKYLRDIVISFLIAGRDTTAQATSWFFKCLTQNPQVEEKIRAEIKAKLPHLSTDPTAFPTMEDVSQLVYLEAALRETLRLHPSVPLNTKFCVKDTVLNDGTFIRAGMAVAIPTYCLGRNKQTWGEDAYHYKPERWLDDKGKLKIMPPYKFNAFHGGPRICLGMNLAMLEMKILTSSILRSVHLEVQDPDKVSYALSLTLPIRGALTTKVTKL